MQSCCSGPIASASSCCSLIASIRFVTAVPPFRPLQLLLAASLRPLRLLFPDFNSSPVACASAAAPPIVSASTTAPRLRALRLLLPDFNSSPVVCASAAAPRLCPLRLQLPDCVRFGCCSLIACTSAAAPRLHPLNACSLTCSGRFQPMPSS